MSKANDLLARTAGTRPVLGIDTGTPIAALGLVVDGRIAGSISQPVPSHCASLPLAVDELLRASGLTPRDLGAIAVGIGPGSFTGLRIGLSYAKGLVMASGCAIVGVNSLDALAATTLASPAAHQGVLVCPLVDARRGEIYAALYRIVSDGLEKLSEDLVVALEHLTSRIEGEVVLVGDSRANDAAALLSSRGLGVAVLDICSLDSRGGLLAAIGAARFSRGEIDRPASLEPLYLRPPAAALKSRSGQSAQAVSRTEDLWSDERKNSSGSI
ncbi:MAG TPA: tRNA (adenosine(37)-N6)-threonylcarbamoyltransferase complex dimerization subunit type 1 TsaB [Candidatus Binataceae bacterium]